MRIGVDGGICETCHEAQGYIVHHKIIITPENISRPEVTLSFGNLKYDCKDCHDREEAHPFISGEKSRCVFDCDGNPIPRDGRWDTK